MASSQTEQLLLQATEATIVSYPPRLLQVTAPTIRLRTANQQMPAVGVAADVDDLIAHVSTAALRGEALLEIALPGTTTLNSLDTAPPSNSVAEPREVMSFDEDLAPFTTYDVTIPFTLQADFVGPPQKQGTLTAEVTTDADSITVVSSSLVLTLDTNPADWTVGLSSTGLTLTFGIYGTFVTTGVLTDYLLDPCTATPRASSTTFVKGRQYLVVDDDTGDTVVVVAMSDGADGLLRLGGELTMPIASGSSVLGWAVLYDVTIEQVATYGRGVAVWEATDSNDATTRWVQDIRIAQREIAPQMTSADIGELSPYALSLQPPNDPDFAKTLRAAWVVHVVPVLLAQGIRPELIVSWEQLTAWIIAAIEMHLAENFETNDVIVARKRDNLRTAETLVKNGVRFWVDDGMDLGQAGRGDGLGNPSEDGREIKGWNVTYTSR